MKFEMSSVEFSEFCAQLTNGNAFARLQGLESELQATRNARDSVEEDRDYYQQRAARLANEIDNLNHTHDEARAELNQLRILVKDLQDKLTPHRLERGLSRAFAEFNGGRKIMAIKEIRALLNLDLKSAKDVVEGSFKDANYPNSAALSNIFAAVGRGDGLGFLYDQLRPLVTVTSNEDLNSILEGNFHIPGGVLQTA